MKTRGFTLIEALIYMGLLTILLGGFLSSAYALFETNDRNQASAILIEETNFIVEKIDRLLDETKSVVTPVADASDTTLAVEAYDGSVRNAALQDGNIVLDAHPLNNSNSEISDLVFIHHVLPEYVEASFTVSTKTSNGMPLSRHASTTHSIGI